MDIGQLLKEIRVAARDIVKEKTEPKAGETWYVRLCGAGTLSTVVIYDITAKTVAFERHIGLYAGALVTGSGPRYSRADIDFIERVEG